MFFRKFPGRDFPGGPCTSTAGDMGLIPGQGTKIPHATHSAPPRAPTKKKKKKIKKRKSPSTSIPRYIPQRTEDPLPK